MKQVIVEVFLIKKTLTYTFWYDRVFLSISRRSELYIF